MIETENAKNGQGQEQERDKQYDKKEHNEEHEEDKEEEYRLQRISSVTEDHTIASDLSQFTKDPPVRNLVTDNQHI